MCFNIEEQEFLNELKSDINTNKYVKEYYQYIKDTKESIENINILIDIL